MKKSGKFYKLICLGLCLLLTGCVSRPVSLTPSTENKTETIPPVPEKMPITLRLLVTEYSGSTGETWLGVGGFRDTFISKLDHEGIDLNITVLSASELKSEVYKSIDEERDYDILLTDPLFIEDISSELIPAEGYLPQGLKGEFYGIPLPDYGLPAAMSVKGLLYNKNLLDAAGLPVPTTLEELAAAAESLKALDGCTIPFGADLTEKGKEAVDAAFPDRERLLALKDRGLMGPRPDRYTTADLNGEFLRGGVGMMLGSYVLKDAFPGAEFAPFPAGGSSFAIYDCFGVMHTENDGSRRREALDLFFSFFYGEGYEAYLNGEGLLPITESATESFKIKKPELAPVFSNIIFTVRNQ